MLRSTPAGFARTPSGSRASATRARCAGDRRHAGRAGRGHDGKTHNRLLVAFYVISDALLAMWAFILAYVIRFESGLIPVTRGYPPLEQYLNVLPFVAVLTPLAFHCRASTGCGADAHASTTSLPCSSAASSPSSSASSRRCTSGAYYARERAGAGAYQVSQIVWALLPRAERHVHLRVARSACASCSSGGGAPASA